MQYRFALSGIDVLMSPYIIAEIYYFEPRLISWAQKRHAWYWCA